MSHHLFVLDPIEKLNLELDTSLRIARELTKLGDQVSFCTIDRFRWTRGTTPTCLGRSLQFPKDQLSHLNLGEPTWQSLDSFQAIHMRKDPPFDMQYMSITWLLSQAGPTTKVWNSGEAIRRFNEKLAILEFPQYCAPAVVTAKHEDILDFAKAHGGDVIIKPLDLFGGRGISRLDTSVMTGSESLQILAEKVPEDGSLRIIQPFDKRIFSGEIRAFTVGGRAVAWCLKKPAAGNFLANTSSGATLHPYEPSPKVAAMVSEVAERLFHHGIAFCGFDIIGDYISEINVTSPRLLLPPGADEISIYREVAQWTHMSCVAS